MPLTGLSFHDDRFNNPCSSFSSFISLNFKQLCAALMQALTDLPYMLFSPHSLPLLSVCFCLIIIIIVRVDFRPDKHIVENVDLMQFSKADILDFI